MSGHRLNQYGLHEAAPRAPRRYLAPPAALLSTAFPPMRPRPPLQAPAPAARSLAGSLRRWRNGCHRGPLAATTPSAVLAWPPPSHAAALQHLSGNDSSILPNPASWRLPVRHQAASRRACAQALVRGDTPTQPPPGAVQEALDLGPAADLLSAMDTLSYVRTFSQLGAFLESNSQLFVGPEVAAVVLQAANVSELASKRQITAAMEVVERRAAALEGTGEAEGGDLTPDVLAGAVDDWLRSAGPYGTGGGGSDDVYGSGGGVLAELEVAERVMAWATPVLRQHIKRYPPDAVMALVSALAQLEQYDSRLMELVSESFKADPGTWLARAAAGSAGLGEEGTAGHGSDDDGGGDSDEGREASDPWVVLVSLARAFARLGHYDPGFMAAVARQAVKLLPEVSERAEREDYRTMDGDDGGASGAAVGTVLLLLWSFLEVNHLDAQLMQAVGELLAAFSHQLDCSAACEVLLAFAAFGARNPPFYSLMLRRVLAAPQDTLSPRAAGLLYRACILITAMGDVPALTPAAVAPVDLGETAALSKQAVSEAAVSEAAVSEAAVSEDDRQVAAALAALLRSCLSAFPVSELSGTYLARPSPEQLEEADEGLLAAWEATGLLAAPQVLATLQEIALDPQGQGEGGRKELLELLPLEALAPPSSYGTYVNRRTEGEGDGDGLGSGGASGSEPVVGGADAPAWVPADALLLYDMYGKAAGDGGGGSRARIAVKVLDDRRHGCPGAVVPPTPTPPPHSTATAAPAGLRLRGPALSELRCLEVWGWRVLVVPIGLWAGFPGEEERMEWLRRRLRALMEAAPVGAVLRL